MPVKVRLYGVDKVKANLRQFSTNMREKGKRSIAYRWGLVLRRSEALCPEDEGDLVESAKLTFSPNGLSATISYGGPGIPYAIAAHEHLSVHSPYSWRAAGQINWTKPGSGPKYLERPVMEALTQLPRQLQEDLRVEDAL